MSKERTFYSGYVEAMFKDSPTEIERDDQRELYALLHGAVGLAGEASEVLEVIKKVYFTGDQDFNDNKREELIYELGDVEFYLQAIRNALHIERDEVLQKNIIKLDARHGDNNVSKYYRSSDTRDNSNE